MKNSTLFGTSFLTADFLLSNATARALYHNCAETLPIIDYHCHLDPKEIYEDRTFENITQVWLAADHYKWRLMRSAGVPEEYITGTATDREKFQKWAETLGLAIGNPLYHWSHLELKNYFGYNGVLSGETAEQVWQCSLAALRTPEMSARNLILRSGVTAICTTDDPADSLEWHRKLADDNSFPVRVLPSFRPDKAMGIEKAGYPDYLEKLAAAAGSNGIPAGFAELMDILKERLAYFVSLGCRVSDHGMEEVPYLPATEKELEAIYQKRLRGETVSRAEEQQFKTAVLVNLGREYARYGIVMQLHFGVIRDLSRRTLRALGPDAGIDAIGDEASPKKLAAFLNALDESGELPKTVLYSLNPGDNTTIETVMGAFQASCCEKKDGYATTPSKMQHGSAWWFNDHRHGITEQLTSLANEGYLAGFVGMLTDSRSLLSYARHEYFRRILCDLLGTWVENGEFPAEENALRAIVEGICVKNAEQYLNL